MPWPGCEGQRRLAARSESTTSWVWDRSSVVSTSTLPSEATRGNQRTLRAQQGQSHLRLAEEIAPATIVRVRLLVVRDEPLKYILEQLGVREVRIRGRTDAFFAETAAALAPWGIQLAGNFSKSIALASFGRARDRYAAILGDVRPMIIGTRLRHRGTRAFYRIRVPSETRASAEALCARIRRVGGACLVLKT